MSQEVKGSGSERRVGYRLKCELVIEISKKSDMWFYEALVSDISLGGVNVYSNSELNTADEVLCNLELDGNSICVDGVVMHKDYSEIDNYIYSYGIRFDFVGKDEGNTIENYLFNKHKEIIREHKIW